MESHKCLVATLKIIILTTVDAFLLSSFVLWKMFQVIRSPQDDQQTISDQYELSQMSFTQDRLLGSLVIFANGEYVLLFSAYQLLQTIFIYVM